MFQPSSPLRLLSALLLWLALPCVGIAQTAQYESLTIEQGLSQGMVYDLYGIPISFSFFDILLLTRENPS